MQIADTREENPHGAVQEYRIPVPRGEIYAKGWVPATATNAPDTAPIVLFHDSLGCVDLWRDFPAALANATGRCVYAYDRPGFGRSSPHAGGWSANFIRDEAEHIFPLLRAALGFDDFVVYGYSVGGGMALGCAALFPQHCRAVITQSAQAFVDDGVRDGIRQAEKAFAQPGQVERLGKYHGDKATWVLRTWIDTWLSDEFTNWRIEQLAGHVDSPLLVMHGDQDEYGSLAHPRRIASLGRGQVILVILENCHHVPHREYPERVLAEVARFLAAVP